MLQLQRQRRAGTSTQRRAPAIEFHPAALATTKPACRKLGGLLIQPRSGGGRRRYYILVRGWGHVLTLRCLGGTYYAFGVANHAFLGGLRRASERRGRGGLGDDVNRRAAWVFLMRVERVEILSHPWKPIRRRCVGRRKHLHA